MYTAAAEKGPSILECTIQIHLPRPSLLAKALELECVASAATRPTEPRACSTVSSCRRGVVSIWSMFVFLALLIFYPNTTLSEFAKAAKTSRAAKLYWRPLNSKGSLPVLKSTSESEYFGRFTETLFFPEAKSNHFTPRCACAARGK